MVKRVELRLGEAFPKTVWDMGVQESKVSLLSLVV